jgi:maltose O-acetyltransferase
MPPRHRSEREKMLAGELYLASDPELVTARIRARRLWQRFNLSAPDDAALRSALMRDLLGHLGDGSWIEPPFYCDYGTQIEVGEGVFINMNCVLLDPAAIRIGEGAQLGPGVQLLTADHPRDATERTAGPEYARPISIGARVWLGGGVIVCPGVTIGDGTTIGAGSVVTRDIPAGVVAVGNPCRVRRGRFNNLR